MLLFWAALAFADTECHSREGDLKFESHSRNGGTPPGPGMVVGTERWTLGDREIALLKRFERRTPPEEQGPAPDLEWKWEGWYNVEKYGETPNTVTAGVRYSTFVQIWSTSGAEVAGLVQRQWIEMECNQAPLGAIP